MRKTRQTPKNVKENIMEEEPVIPQALEPVIDTKKMCDDENQIELNKYNLQNTIQFPYWFWDLNDMSVDKIESSNVTLVRAMHKLKK